ncbi:transposase [Embleya scabrispora]|uniref:transposase n=1 Tax=Embleya scabrispora TaxID=159449 RepID=UPI00099E90AB|nr:transposase [Embleya scabrispora]MYS87743.1 hypothetical protein [Streptomyces sp. SID5474]
MVSHQPVALRWVFCGALGRRANRRVAFGVDAATGTASCPLQLQLQLQWRPYLPGEWVDDPARCRAVGIR